MTLDILVAAAFGIPALAAAVLLWPDTDPHPLHGPDGPIITNGHMQ